MYLTIRKELAEAIGIRVLKPYDLSEEGWFRGVQSRSINMASLQPKRVVELRKLLAEHQTMRGVGVLLSDIDTWVACLAGGAGVVKARSVKQFTSALMEWLRPLPHHVIFRQWGEHLLPYYVDTIRYDPEHNARDSYTPPMCKVHLLYTELGEQTGESLVFKPDECVGLTPPLALAKQTFLPETAERWKQYEEQRDYYRTLYPQIGLQLSIVGEGTDDLDGNPKSSDSWYWRATHTYPLGTPENPARGIVDVFVENPEGSSRRRGRRDEYAQREASFWARTKPHSDEDDDDEGEEEQLHEGEIETIEFPIHPILAVFDPQRHLRLRVHVGSVTPYVYDTQLADKLILDPIQKSMVSLLVEHKDGGFQDIVKGKSGGAVVLLTGPPGTGKTLTAEVFSEAKQRPLYSVQCSQLGTAPDDLEEALLKVFARAARWGAIMLLDEADVYVHKRGDDLIQNAIVGVFLRVLEYQAAVLFLTTNRPDDVDDAIASRCIARLNYSVPDAGLQKKMWAVLAEGGGLTLSPKVIEQLVHENPTCSGRDIKNLLKLAMLVGEEQGVTAKTIAFVKQFKPA